MMTITISGDGSARLAGMLGYILNLCGATVSGAEPDGIAPGTSGRMTALVSGMKIHIDDGEHPVEETRRPYFHLGAEA